MFKTMAYVDHLSKDGHLQGIPLQVPCLLGGWGSVPGPSLYP